MKPFFIFSATWNAVYWAIHNAQGPFSAYANNKPGPTCRIEVSHYPHVGWAAGWKGLVSEKEQEAECLIQN